MPLVHREVLRFILKRKTIKSQSLVLTFDDGPSSRLTPAILKILDENNAKASFFLLGRNIQSREEIVRQLAKQGHEICSHGYNHLHQWKVSPIRAIKDIKHGWQAIDNALGTNRGKYPFRPPYGKLNLFSLLYLWIHKIPIYYWTLVSSDTWPAEKRDSQRVALLVSKTGGAVSLAHDFDRTTDDVDNMVLDSVRLALLAARRAGMSVVTISELLDAD